MVDAKSTKMGVIKDLKTQFPRKILERKWPLGYEILRHLLGDSARN